MAEQRHELGTRIQQARLEKRWKQKELAAAVNVEPDTVSRWENGRHAPDLGMLDLLARVLGKPIGYFVDEPVSPSPTADLEALLAAVAETNQRVIALLEALASRDEPQAAVRVLSATRG